MGWVTGKLMLMVDGGLEVCDFREAGASVLEGEDNGGGVGHIKVEVYAWSVFSQ